MLGLWCDAASSTRVSSRTCGQSLKRQSYSKDPDSNEFLNAFVRETNAHRARELKTARTQKRFEHCYLGEAASHLYQLLSAFTIHGGSPKQLANTPHLPNDYSCMLLLRPDPSNDRFGTELELLGDAAEILCVELCSLIRLVAQKYRMASAISGEGVRFISEFIDPSIGSLREAILSAKADLRWP
jgi:hypothetical protein